MKPFATPADEIDFFASEPTYLPRSRLFSLLPIGLGTPDQESLISLIVRTSRAHLLNPRHLVANVFPEAAPQIEKLGTAFFRRDGATVNGIGQYAELFVSAMSELSGRQYLRQLTLLPWKDVFPHNGQGLLARHPKWCPICLSEQLCTQEGTAFLLRWAMEASSICLKHRVRLQSACPSCGRPQPFLPRYPDQGVCHHCRCSLALGKTQDECSSFELWAADAIGDLLRGHAEVADMPTFRRFQQFVAQQVEKEAGGNRASFCRSMGFNSHGVRGWLDRGERPSFSQFLKLCFGLNVMPGEIFREGGGDELVTKRSLPAMVENSRRRCPRLSPDEQRKFGELLQVALQSDDVRSLSSIAAEIVVLPSCLKYWFPESCLAISRRHRLAARSQSLEREIRQCARIEDVVTEIKSEGAHPSRRKVTRALRAERIALIRPRLSAAYSKAVRKKS